MRIALVTETYPPEVNGVAMTLERLVHGLADRGHAVAVLRPHQGRDERVRPHDRVEHHLTPSLPMPGYKGLRLGLPSLGWCRGKLARWRPDVVHVATEGPLGWSAIRAARARRLPVSSTFHTNFHAYGHDFGVRGVRRLMLAYLRWTHNCTDRTFVPTRALADALTANGFRNVGVLGRGVDLTLFDPARRDPALRASWGAGPDTPVALYVGRVALEKNIPLAVRAAEAARAVLPDLKFVLVGDGPAKVELETAHREYVFAGVQRGDALARHYASGDLFLFPSETETFGNVVSEALASGLPVLAFHDAAARELIRPWENGLTVPLGQAEAYVDAARALAIRRTEWPPMGRAARETALGLSWERIVAGFERDLQALVEAFLRRRLGG